LTFDPIAWYYAREPLRSGSDRLWEVHNISASDYRINESIRVPEVRLIDADGENKGVVAIDEARAAAESAGLDLVEVAPKAEPPVCRVLDFGKFLYEQAKKDREARKAQTKVEIKEIRLRPKTSEHHRSFKVKNARRWLTEGKKVSRSRDYLPGNRAGGFEADRRGAGRRGSD
jgi:translation initiation factor IF-3